MIKMLKIYTIFIIMFIACSEPTDSNYLLQNYNKFENQFKYFKKYELDEVNLEHSALSISLATKMFDNSVLNSSENLGIKKIKYFREGVFFITGDSKLGKQGYFRTVVPFDSLKNFSVLKHVKNNWYIWYQD